MIDIPMFKAYNVSCFVPYTKQCTFLHCSQSFTTPRHNKTLKFLIERETETVGAGGVVKQGSV